MKMASSVPGEGAGVECGDPGVGCHFCLEVGNSSREVFATVHVGILGEAGDPAVVASGGGNEGGGACREGQAGRGL
jgi:hypothetical protein